MFDVAIIGGGVIGSAVAYELSKHNVSAVLLERDNDVANRTTKANSAIVHAGYDPIPGSKMARLNVLGSNLMEGLCKKLDVEYDRIGSLVLAFDDDDMKTINTLLDRGIKNGVKGLEILPAEKVFEKEPNLSREVKAALWAPTAAVINPWELCIAMAETAVKNGVEVLTDHEVTKIKKTAEGYRITAGGETFDAKYVINAAGTASDKVHDMVAKHDFTIVPTKGEYYLLDKNAGGLVNTTVFQCPSKVGKGVLVSPTVHGNIIIGPDAQVVKTEKDVSSTAAGLESVRVQAARSVPNINYRQSIRNFSGVRAHTEHADFIIEEVAGAKGFIDLAGICSPGLSAAPAIALECLSLLESSGLKLIRKDSFTDERHVVRFKSLPMEKRAELIAKNPLYGRIICRCEVITEGEIVDALHRPLAPKSVDGIKRRCGSGMGRCQGGFCCPRVQEIIARELNIPMDEVLLGDKGTNIITGETKGGAQA